MKPALLSILTLILTSPIFAADAKTLAIHEWGTFTSLQDEQGNAIGGINSDDEPVPYFVHRLSWNLIIGAPVQGAPRCHPDVTMRLETPVVYFHRAPGDEGPRKVQLSAEFHGGWISEYFPQAQLKLNGKDVTEKKLENERLKPETVSRVTWDATLDFGGGVTPETTDHVWITPREVKASDVKAGAERERYLFYRGVGHLDAPLRVTRKADRMEIERRDGVKIDSVWLADIHADGSCAFAKTDVSAGGPTEFKPSEFAKENLSKLRDEMHGELVTNGLNEDEATAMLKTWELSYFKSAGLRMFFLVPREWTEKVLPLTVSEPADITRVMVGRIELVSKDQREKLVRIASGKLSGVELEKEYHTLGRFRDALVLEQAKHNPSDALKKFIAARQLNGSPN
jgi:hypothetical protein